MLLTGTSLRTGSADGGEASDGEQRSAGGGGDKGAGPVAALTAVLGGLQSINQWLAGLDGADRFELEIAAEMMQTVMAGLGHVDSLATAARARAIVQADELRLADQAGAVSDSAWVAQVFRLSRAAGARECDLAQQLAGQPDTLAALEQGRISRDHATAVTRAAAEQQRDHDHREAAERDASRRAQAQRAQAARQAAEQARTAAEAEATRRAAEKLERQIAEQQRAERQAREAAAQKAIEDRAADLLGQAAAGRSPDAVRKSARDQRADDNDALTRAEAAQHSRRSVKHWKDQATGMGQIRASLSGEAYDTYLVAIGAAMTFDSPGTPTAETRTREQRTADAFIDMVEASLAAGDLSTSGGVKPHLTVTGTIQTLTDQDDTAGETQYGTRLSAETIRRIACDAGLTRAILNATGQVLDIGRETRQWTVAQNRAAALTFGGCAFPVADGEACGRPMGWSDLHHVRYWENGGHTNINNAIPLCRRHHIIVHRNDHDLSYHAPTLTVRLTTTGRDDRPATRQATFARSESDLHKAPPSASTSQADPERLPL